MSDPEGSGYADDMGQGAVENCKADMDHLLGPLDPSSLWVTRIRGELSRDALAADLELSAAADQSPVAQVYQIAEENQTGDPCPPGTYPDCYPGEGEGSAAGDGAADAPGASIGCGCVLGARSGFQWGVATVLALGAAAAGRRRSRRRS
jgi:hypothetical protein